jgi:hypothetical protein
MNDLRLEPYAAQQHWQMPAPLAGRDWQTLLVAYLAALAHACAAAGPAVIGHIKALALFPDGGYLRVSAVSATHPPTTDGRPPDGLAELTLTLNVLVYGIARDVLSSLTCDIASTLAAAHAGLVIEELPSMGTDAPHEHPRPDL